MPSRVFFCLGGIERGTRARIGDLGYPSPRLPPEEGILGILNPEVLDGRTGDCPSLRLRSEEDVLGTLDPVFGGQIGHRLTCVCDGRTLNGAFPLPFLFSVPASVAFFYFRFGCYL